MVASTACTATPLPALVGVQTPKRASSPSNYSPAAHGFSTLGIARNARPVPHGLSSVLAASRPHAPRTLAAEHARRLLMSTHRLEPTALPPYPQPASVTPPRRMRSPEPVADKAPYAIQHHAPRSASQANPAALAAATTTAPAHAPAARPADVIRDSLDSVLWSPPSAALRQTSSLHDNAALFRSHSGDLGNNHSAAGVRCASAPPGDDDRAYALDGFGSDDDAQQPPDEEPGVRGLRVP